MQSVPRITPSIVNATALAPTNAGLRKSDRSSIGRSGASSTTRNTTIRTADADEQATIWVEPQPLSFPRTSAKTSRNSDARERDQAEPVDAARVRVARLARPASWSGRPRRSRSGRSRRRSTPSRSPEVMTPPTSGPTATAPPITAAVDPEGVPRSLPLEGRGDQGQRGGEHHRAAHALHGRGRG